jgi:Arc/MetJ family transcription regulator
MSGNSDRRGSYIRRIMELGGFSTKASAVNAALEAYVTRLARQQVLDLRGKVTWQGDLEQMRRGR